jgi:hypothetical protein
MPMIGVRQIPSLFRMSAIAGGNIGMPAWSVAEQLSSKAGAESGPAPHSASDQCSCGLAMAEHESAYNEEAFHYLLAVERKRFEHSSRAFVLLLVDLEGRSGQTARIDFAAGARVFAGLARTLRDTDVIGWYREGRIAGAVLTHLGDASITDVSRQMADRVTRTLRNDLPEAIASRVKVRLYQPLASVQP